MGFIIDPYRYSSSISLTMVNTVNANTVFSTAAQNYRGFAVSHDGNYLMFDIYAGVERFSRMALATAYDLSSTITVAHYTKWNAQPIGVCFNPDGTIGYNLQLGHTIFQKTLTGAYAMDPNSSPQSIGSLSINSTANYTRGMHFNSDGTILYVLNVDNIKEITFSTAYDCTTASITDTIDLSSIQTTYGNTKGFVYLNSGNSILMVTQGGYFLLFNLSTAYDLSTMGSVLSEYSSGYTLDDVGMGGDETYVYTYESNGDVRQWALTY